MSDRTLQLQPSGLPEVKNRWTYGKPDWDERYRKRHLEKARVLREQAAAIEASCFTCGRPAGEVCRACEARDSNE